LNGGARGKRDDKVHEEKLDRGQRKRLVEGECLHKHVTRERRNRNIEREVPWILNTGKTREQVNQKDTVDNQRRKQGMNGIV
jgi:hypothetical protein